MEIGMLCSRCKKRPAVVFITRMEGDKPVNDGICLTCAKELGIKPVDDIMKQFGITDEQLDAMEDQFAGMMENGDMNLGEMMQSLAESNAAPDGADEEEPDDNDGKEDFTPGGAGTFPFSIFGIRRERGENGGEGEKKNPREREKGKKRKMLDGYCENLTAKAKAGNGACGSGASRCSRRAAANPASARTSASAARQRMRLRDFTFDPYL